MIAFTFIPGDTIQWAAVLIDAAVKGLVVLLLAAGATLLLRRSSAAVRHMTWTLSIAALILVPFLSLALPQLQVPLLPDWAGMGGLARMEQIVAQSPAVGESGFGTGGPGAESVMPAGDWPSPAGAPQPVHPADAAPETPAAPVPAAAAPQPPPVHWSAWVLLAWLAGAAALLLPLLAGTIIVWRQARRAERITSGSWGNLLDELRPRLGVRGRVVLLRSNWPNIPLTCGILHPAIILPAEADNWPADRRRVVLLHELAHIRRRDCLTQLLARLARVIYWFNPLVWLAGRMLRIEREQACDDLVLASGHKASDYASHLLEIVRSLHSVRCPSLAAVAMARKSQFEGRLLAILDPRRNRRSLTRWGLLIAVLLAVAVAIPLAILRAAESSKPDIQQNISQLQSNDESVWKPAVGKLIAIGPSVAEPLAELFAKGGPGDAHAMQVLEGMATNPGVQALMRKGLDSKSPNVVHCSMLILGKSGNQEHAKTIAALLERNTIAACIALSELGGEEAFQALVSALNKPNIEPRWLVVEHLARLGKPGAIPGIKEALTHLTGEELATAQRYVAAIHKLEGDGSRPGLTSFSSFHAMGDRNWRVLQGINLDKMDMVYIEPFKPEATPAGTRIKAYQALTAKEGLDLAWDQSEGNRLLAVNGLKLAPYAPALPNGYDVWSDGEKLLDQKQLLRIVEQYSASGRIPEVGERVRAHPFKNGDYFLASLPDGRMAIIGTADVWTKDEHVCVRLAAKVFDPLYQLIPASAFAAKAAQPTTQPAGSRLEFRIAPSASSLTNAERDSYMDGLKAGRVGPWWETGEKQWQGQIPVYMWLPFAGDMANVGNMVMGEYKGQKYVLVSDKPGQTMVTGEGKEAWGLAKAYATTDAMNRPAVGFEMDDRGAELFTGLTKANIGNVLAIVVDAKVVSVPVIRAALGKQGVIPGRFTEQEVNALVQALKAGMPPATQPAGQPATRPADDVTSKLAVRLARLGVTPETTRRMVLTDDEGGFGPNIRVEVAREARKAVWDAIAGAKPFNRIAASGYRRVEFYTAADTAKPSAVLLVNATDACHLQGQDVEESFRCPGVHELIVPLLLEEYERQHRPATQPATLPADDANLRQMLPGTWREESSPRHILIRADGTFESVQSGPNGWKATGSWKLSGRLFTCKLEKSPENPSWVGQESTCEISALTLDRLELRTRGGSDRSVVFVSYRKADGSATRPADEFTHLSRELLRCRLRVEVANLLRLNRPGERLSDPNDVDKVLADTAANVPVGMRRLATARLLGWADQRQVLACLTQLAQSKDAFVRLHATEVLALTGRRENVEFLRDIASGKQVFSSSEFERDAAAWTLLALGEKLPSAANDHSSFFDKTLTEIRALQQAGREVGPEVLSRLAAQVTAGRMSQIDLGEFWKGRTPRFGWLGPISYRRAPGLLAAGTLELVQPAGRHVAVTIFGSEEQAAAAVEHRRNTVSAVIKRGDNSSGSPHPWWYCADQALLIVVYGNMVVDVDDLHAKFADVEAELRGVAEKVRAEVIGSPVASKLEFRISLKPSDLDKAELASYMDWLKAGKVGFWQDKPINGRVESIAGRMPDHAWLAFAGDMANAGNLVMGEYKGQKYVLVSDKPGQTMVPGEGKNAWGLAKAYATKDAMNLPAVGFEMDDRGAELFSAFTKANIGNALAIVIDGKVVSAPVIRAAIGKQGTIPGQFTEQQVAALVKALKAGMGPATQPAQEQPVTRRATAFVGLLERGEFARAVGFLDPDSAMLKARDPATWLKNLWEGFKRGCGRPIIGRGEPKAVLEGDRIVVLLPYRGQIAEFDFTVDYEPTTKGIVSLGWRKKGHIAQPAWSETTQKAAEALRKDAAHFSLELRAAIWSQEGVGWLGNRSIVTDTVLLLSVLEEKVKGQSRACVVDKVHALKIIDLLTEQGWLEARQSYKPAAKEPYWVLKFGGTEPVQTSLRAGDPNAVRLLKTIRDVLGKDDGAAVDEAINSGMRTATQPAPAETEAQEFCIMGEVERPGVYSLGGRRITVKMALAAAGFAMGKKNMAVVLIRRLNDSSEQQVVLNADALIAGWQQDVLLRKGDVVLVRPAKDVLDDKWGAPRPALNPTASSQPADTASPSATTAKALGLDGDAGQEVPPHAVWPTRTDLSYGQGERPGGALTILGTVNRPGKYAIDPNGTRIADALAKAGDVSQVLIRYAYVVRQAAGGKTTTVAVDLHNLMAGDPRFNVVLRDGDTVFVPPVVPGEFYVMGEVDRPGVYSLTGRKITVKMALAAAGFPLGKKRDMIVVLVRRKGDGSEQRQTLNVDAIVAGTEQDVVLHRDDLLMVRPAKDAATSTSSGQTTNEGARIKLGPSWQAALDIHEGEVRLRLKDAAGKISTLRCSQIVLDSAAGIRATTGPAPSASAGQADGATKDRVEVTSAAIAVIDVHAGNIRVRCGGRTLEAAEIILGPAKAEATTRPTTLSWGKGPVRIQDANSVIEGKRITIEDGHMRVEGNAILKANNGAEVKGDRIDIRPNVPATQPAKNGQSFPTTEHGRDLFRKVLADIGKVDFLVEHWNEKGTNVGGPRRSLVLRGTESPRPKEWLSVAISEAQASQIVTKLAKLGVFDRLTDHTYDVGSPIPEWGPPQPKRVPGYLLHVLISGKVTSGEAFVDLSGGGDEAVARIVLALRADLTGQAADAADVILGELGKEMPATQPAPIGPATQPDG